MFLGFIVCRVEDIKPLDAQQVHGLLQVLSEILRQAAVCQANLLAAVRVDRGALRSAATAGCADEGDVLASGCYGLRKGDAGPGTDDSNCAPHRG